MTTKPTPTQYRAIEAIQSRTVLYEADTGRGIVYPDKRVIGRRTLVALTKRGHLVIGFDGRLHYTEQREETE